MSEAVISMQGKPANRRSPVTNKTATAGATRRKVRRFPFYSD